MAEEMTEAGELRALAPIRAWILPSGTPRAWRRCVRWHGRWRIESSATSQDCSRCGLRWTW